MSKLVIEFDGVEGLYVLEALTAKSAENHNRILRMIEQGAAKGQFELEAAMAAAVFVDAAHRRVEEALFGSDDNDAIAHQLHAARGGDSECERCIAIGEQQQVDWYLQ